MGRATTKKDLIESATIQYQKVTDILNSMTLENINKPFSFSTEGKKEAHWMRDKNLRDVLIHLFEWHQLLLLWIESNLNNDQKPFLPLPYNWKTYGELNIEFWKKHQNTSYDESIHLFNKSHNSVMKEIDKFTNDELFSKGHFTWTGGSSLGQYCVSVTASHYEWALKKIKVHKVTLT